MLKPVWGLALGYIKGIFPDCETSLTVLLYGKTIWINMLMIERYCSNAPYKCKVLKEVPNAISVLGEVTV